MNKEKEFVGIYKNLLNDFVELKRNLGYIYDVTRAGLRLFSVFSLSYNIKGISLKKDLVFDWTAKRKNESVNTWEHRSSDLRQFALFLQNIGYKAYIPPKKYKFIRQEYIPYIFTHKEIFSLFKSIDSIRPHLLSLKHMSFPLLFRLLYCCGLRISEVIKLKICDFQFDEGILKVNQSKFSKDRLVVMSKALCDMVVKYNSLFNKKDKPNDFFFRNKTGTQLTYRWVYAVYRQLLWKARISHGGKGKGPRLHDLRHTFCVHSLEQQVKSGTDIYIALPILSTYIGHSSVNATQRYVRLTTEAFPEILQKVSKTCSFVFPEVKKV